MFQSEVKNFPKPLNYCEALFDKNVLRIKKLIHDIGDLSKLIHKKQNIFFYMMIAKLLIIHFLQKSIRNYNPMVQFH